MEKRGYLMILFFVLSLVTIFALGLVCGIAFADFGWLREWKGKGGFKG